ncbi:hypothetical protein MSEN_42980 [Mycolicibacter senuensis]|uniref:Uncharacterized protein n=1 Tax=Mycolicibacter senuensis TaxID=386913 RepID=A0A7I9XS13_9MYCO|nr:hypothetical protein MSEN_42980 [Mycolicibacter senuensis]
MAADPIWGILFRFACAGVALAGHTTSAHPGASGPKLAARSFFTVNEAVCGRHARPRGPVDQDR